VNGADSRNQDANSYIDKMINYVGTVIDAARVDTVIQVKPHEA
jgi:hypothetical protein